MGRGKSARTLAVLDAAVDVIESASAAMTVRQVCYQLVSRHVIGNNRSQYQLVSNLLVQARRDGTIGWSAIEDRQRKPRSVDMWADLANFLHDVSRAYRRDVWPDQPQTVEVWLEKDALSGVFADVLRPFGVTLNVGRGYDGWSSINAAAERSSDVILYFGDFDPSGEDMVRSLEERLNDLGCYPEIAKVALTFADIDRYQLPPDFAKATDSRAPAFVAKYGNRSSVELDALPIDVLRERIRSTVAEAMDLDALAETEREQDEEQVRLLALLADKSEEVGP